MRNRGVRGSPAGAWTSYSRALAAWSTGATTPPASPCVADGKLAWAKRAGKLGNLRAALAERPPLTGTVGVGHTRWATHGPPTDPNAHPHTDCGGHLAVVHNGIIENFAVLRTEIEAPRARADLRDRHRAGRAPAGGADGGDGRRSRAPARRRPGRWPSAMRQVCQRLRRRVHAGRVDVRDPEVVVGARRNSPLVVGRGDGENFLASDVAAFIATPGTRSSSARTRSPRCAPTRSR